MFKEKGFAQVVLLILLLFGVVLGVYLVQNRTNLTPFANEQKNTARLSLFGKSNEGYAKGLQGGVVNVELRIKSDADAVNLVSAKLKFDPAILQVESVTTDGSEIKLWVEKYFDNSSGEIAITGGIPSPGLKTHGDFAKIATINFKKIARGKGDINFTTDSKVFRNSDNSNILCCTKHFEVSDEEPSSPSPSPTATIGPSASGSVRPTFTPQPSHSFRPVQYSPKPSGVIPTPSTTFSPKPDQNRRDSFFFQLWYFLLRPFRRD